MSYAGNDSLSPEIRRRVVDTFRQTLEMAEIGNTGEAGLGCDFILRLDPDFEPARLLKERLEGGEDLDVDGLREALGEAAEVAEAEGAATIPIAPPGEAAAEIPEEPEPAPAPPAEDAADVADEVPPGPEAAPVAESESEDLAFSASDIDHLFDDLGDASGASPAPAAPPGAEVGELEIFAVGPSPGAPAPAPAADLPAADVVGAEPAPPVHEPAPEPSSPAGPPSQDSRRKTSEQPGVALDSESEQRIRDLLDEGQAAFDDRQYQAAIDAWSRIFLIDIDHPEANHRIEQARKLKAEAERSVEEALHEGMTHLNNGDIPQARAIFERIIATQPTHATALEYLEKLDRAAELGAEALADIIAPPPARPDEEPALDLERSEADVPAAPGEEEEPKAAPERPPRRREPSDSSEMAPPVAEPAPSRRRFFLIIGAAVLVVVLAGGGFLYSRWDSFFPNAVEAPVAEARPGPIERAQQLHAEGRTSMAIAQLRRLAPDSPHYAEAQALIDSWETAQESEHESAESRRQAEREALIERAAAARDAGDFLAAEALFEQAAAIAPLDGEAATLAVETRRRVDTVREQLGMFQQGEWEYALRELWKKHTAAPDDMLIRRLMADCYYNLGVRDLQRGDTRSASEQFGEALGLRPGEPELERLARFAATYQQRPQDLLYRIFVKYLPFR